MYNIKLIIWDLDNSFWQGILSEEEIVPVQRNLDLVRLSVDKGIMNSICSKNDYEQAKQMLESEKLDGIWDLFVFPSIDWTAKGPRLKQMLEDMALRAENVLFVDDEPANLREAQLVVPGIQVADPSMLDELYRQVQTEGSTDLGHSRLKRYRTLEKKTEKRKQASSNEQFLRDSDIRIQLIYDCKPYAERIHDLLSRANQLNFTKIRPSLEEIKRLLDDETYVCALVKAQDNYGDYGEVGFYAMEKGTPHKLLHFTFSCRSLGMGIEQYIWQKLGYPPIELSGKTAVKLERDMVVDWIREVDPIGDESAVSISGGLSSQKKTEDISKQRILLKGPCDIDGMIPYLSPNNQADLEANFVDSRNIIVAGSNNSIHLYEAFHTSLEEIRETIKRTRFLCEADFMTYMFQDPYDVVVFSTLSEGHSGVYRDRRNGLLICFGSCAFDLTDPVNWPRYISGELPNHNVEFTTDSLERFSEEFEFEGHLNPAVSVRNLKWMREKLPKETHLVLILGSEIEANPNTAEFANHAPIYHELNKQIMDAFSDVQGVTLINVTDFITGQDCFNGCTNHFSKLVYYKLAEKIDCVNRYLYDTDNYGIAPATRH